LARQDTLGLPLVGDSTAQRPWITKLTVMRADDSAAETLDIGIDISVAKAKKVSTFRHIT